MCSPHVSFLSNVIPKNVIWSLNSISLPNKVSFCNDPMFIFLLENIMALVFKVEILKPQSSGTTFLFHEGPIGFY